MKMNVKKGDKVEVIAGKDKGKQGVILRSVPQKQRVVVEGCGIVKKAMRPTQQNPQGGIMSVEAPIHVSNVMLVCPQVRQAHPRVQQARGRHEDSRLQEVRRRYRRAQEEINVLCERGFQNPRLLGRMTLPVCFHAGVGTRGRKSCV